MCLFLQAKEAERRRSGQMQGVIISSYKFIIPLANSLFFCFDKNNFPHLRGSLPPPNLPLWRCQPTFYTSKSIKNPSLNHFWSPEPCRPGLLGEEVGSHQQNSAQNSQAPPASRSTRTPSRDRVVWISLLAKRWPVNLDLIGFNDDFVGLSGI